MDFKIYVSYRGKFRKRMEGTTCWLQKIIRKINDFHSRSMSSSAFSSCRTISASTISYIDAVTAQKIDETLMTGPGFSLDQLMELAGLAVANAAMELIDWETSTIEWNVLIACGPGNNGGDGLVAARHLKHFGLSPKVLYPKPNSSPLFLNLVQQCDDLDIPILASVPSNDEHNFSANSLIIDALFGFSFHGPPRPPFEDIIRQIAQTKSSVLSVDIPSGWNVDEGDIHGLAFNPGAVISLTLPKPCMKSYEGIHFLGGRFIPPKIGDLFGIKLPDYGFGAHQIVRLTA